MAGCPDAETLAAYLDGQLFPEQRDRLEEHVAGCDACAVALAEAIRFQSAGVSESEVEDPSNGSQEPSVRRRWVAAAALAMLTGGTLWLAIPGGSGTRSGFVQDAWRPWQGDPRAPLIAATAQGRPLLPRLTGGFRWTGSVETTRALTSRPSQPVPWEYYEAAAKVRRAAADSPTAERLGALADAHLLTGDVDSALITLSRALAAEPSDPRLQSDLAAAYVARGQRQGQAADLAAAVETASAALAAEPGLLEARFNRALALQALHLRGQARRAWEDYLVAETDRDWAAEGREHLAELVDGKAQPQVDVADALRRQAAQDGPSLGPLVADHRFTARRLVEGTLLPAWAEALLAGSVEESRAPLAAAAAIARHYAAQTQDHRLRDQVDEVAAASGETARRLAVAHRSLAAGETALAAYQVAPARRELRHAWASFPSTSVGKRRAEVELLVCDFAENGATDATIAAFDVHESMAGADLATQARISWMRGLSAKDRGWAAAALRHFTSALSLHERLGETEPTAWLHYLLSEAHADAGDQRRAWQHRAAALALVPKLQDPKRRYQILTSSAISSLLGGRPWLAEALLDEVEQADLPLQPFERAELQLWRARLHWQLGRSGAAEEELGRAALAVRSLEDPSLRRRFGAELAAIRGATASTPRLAVAALSRALDVFAALKADSRLPGLLLQRARAYRATGDLAAAERDLRRGIALLESQPLLAPEDDVWLARLDDGRGLYDEMIRIELDRKRPEGAFAWSERGKDRELQLSPLDAGRAVSMGSVAQGLTGGTALVSFAMLESRVLAWRFDERGARVVEIPAARSRIAGAIAVLDADLAAREWNVRTAEAARLLYRALIEPLQIDAATHRLVIVPDKELHAIPFAALIGDSGYLIQQREVEIAPGVASYLRARKHWRELSGDNPNVLAIGDPELDGRQFQGMQRLPGAATEARRVAGFYPAATLVVGRQATRDSVVNAVGRHTIVHLATHALIDDSYPAHSALALADAHDSVHGSVLRADEIRSLDLAGTRTVVLAACGGAPDPLAASVAARLSLPRAFLASGVPTVVASLWPIGDRRSVELLTRVHAQLSIGAEPAMALRRAQLALLASGDHSLRSPATWALFQALGG